MLVLTYEQLVGETEATLRGVAERVDLRSPGLLVPTFNGRPTLANSTEPVERRGVLPSGRPPTVACSTKRRSSDRHAAGDVYERAVAAAGVPAVAR